MTRIGVLVPTYNNAGAIAAVVRGCLGSGLPVFVVDDGSTDGSGRLAADAGATLLVHPVNRGKGSALLTGMRHLADLGFTHAVCLDADGQHDPADIPDFVDAIEADPDALYAGVRDLSAAPEVSRFGRRMSNYWIWVATGWRVADSQCGLRAYPLASVLTLGLGGNRYDLEVEVLIRSLWAGTPVRDRPCRVYYPKPEDRVSSFRPFVDTLRIIGMNARLLARRCVDPRLWPAAQPGARWAGRTRGTAWGWRAVATLFRLFGRKASYRLVDLVAVWFWISSASARHNVAVYQQRLGLHPGAYAIFRSFARGHIDRFAFLLHGPSAFTYARDGLAPLVDVFATQRGAVLLSAHLGNIEVSSGDSGTRERIGRVHAVRFVAPGDHSQEVLAAFPATWRPPTIAVNRGDGFAALAIVRALRAGSVVAMHGDRRVDDRLVEVDFLGHPAHLPAGPWLVAALAGVPVFVTGTFKEGADGYRMVVAPPIYPSFDRRLDRDSQLRAWAQAYADIVAGWARRDPEQWHNFHSFWADQPAAAANPARVVPNRLSGRG